MPTRRPAILARPVPVSPIPLLGRGLVAVAARLQAGPMCHTNESRPPAAPNAGAVEHAAPIELTAADGTVFGAYAAVPAAPNGRNVVILPDVRGVHAYYRALAERFAEAGLGAVAVDYYGRTAGAGARGDDFDWPAHLPLVRPDEVTLDVRAAMSYLDKANPGATFTVGFCFGGGLSWRLAASDLDLAGAIGFYGRPEQVTDVLDRLHRPLLLLLAGDDAATPQSDFRALAGHLTAAGAEHELHTYEGAPHSFFDRSSAEWSAACDDAWRRVLDFTERNGSHA
ncbi:dienelactone hydrolase family protein [Dactylosporangium sp. McL0621]|uniref:dienelactone hydrolase family protein n=1 Tax=Dactylosporangium sp. McL0621 TaxID=3415678 RepID=UPI003CEB4338